MHDSLRALRGIELPERFELLDHIADGGMASVWRARDRTLDREVAIKLLSPAYAHEEAAVRRFEREARAAARLSGHRHVVTIYDVGTVKPERPGGDETPFIAMEYLPGGSVHRARNGGAVDPDLALRWLMETASALDYAHERGVVHRDIKPGNLLLDDRGSVHVADFGIARIAAEASITTRGEVLGTAAYLAPEQALGRPATPDGDRYSLAVLAYELLTGTRPFGNDRLRQLGSDRGALRPPPATTHNPSLPAAVDAVLARGLARVPMRRWPSAGEFVRRLERAFEPAAAVSAGPVQLTPVEPPASESFSAYRSRRLPRRAVAAPLAMIAVIALAVGIALGAHAAGSGPNKRTASAGLRSARTGTAVAARRRPATHKHQLATAAPAVRAPSPPTPSQLDSQGHAMMLAGNYTGAIAVMRQVLAATPPNSLLHAYALFDLGRSLRLSGDPQAAIPVLEQRLSYQVETGIVRTELLLAERAAGVLPAGGPRHRHQHPGGPGQGPGVKVGPPGQGGGAALGT
jgi:tRNA A-37 threonylcarbamoyl transferase component Bud32